ncbi:amino acid permease-like protein [Thermosporothrix hazakensis]|jgi:amino acid transporter|uniref:Amino acid permease-like protein n=2 Tax=Thermosporothrix TaxID=768650 RepID=A0A326UMK2_THEHA|nr:APC family permease [Thermosporothrix hazakensis]PZW31135.1 amino acid permease-like protein [Thermosporothrix hazakensis]BBH86643.1 amino acid transporter [Thermosporothrix sp. COM3]GCE50953.1 amino acid transporter [Thermosporothrix hazakensis]
MSADSTLGKGESGQLRRNTIGLPGVLFQSITTMAPASGLAASLTPAVALTGPALPLTAFIALIVCIFLALTIGSMAKHLPSAGGFYTYISNALGQKVGWLTGWAFNLAYLLIIPFQLLVLGPTADQLVSQYFHISLGWFTWVIIFTVILFLLSYFGIKVSADAGVILGAIEIGVFVLLSIWLLVTNPGNISLDILNPAHSGDPAWGGWKGILMGMTFVLLAFAGFESSVPLAEETINPRRTVPRAILLAAVCIGLFYVFCSFAAMVGWGPANAALYGSPDHADPWAEMAQRAWGPASVIILLAILNSALANANAGVNAVTRVLFAMGRVGTLPKSFAHLNKYGTPDVAFILAMIVALVCSLVPGFVYGPSLAFGFLGTILILPIILIYMLTCISVVVFYLRKHKDEFNVFRHVIVPVIPFLVLLVVLYNQFNPLPAAPLLYAGPIVLAWLVIGVIILAILSVKAPETLAKSDEVFVEGEE